jgi:hypothetical protein
VHPRGAHKEMKTNNDNGWSTHMKATDSGPLQSNEVAPTVSLGAFEYTKLR